MFRLLAIAVRAVKRTGLQRKTALVSRSRIMQRIATMRTNAKSRGGASGQVIRKLDVVARRICMIRAGAMELEDTDSWVGKCTKCGGVKPLQWVHFVTRGTHSLRWSPDNACVMCAGCHFGFMHSHNRSDPSDTRVAEWWAARVGPEAYARILLLKKLPARPDHSALLLALTLEARSLGDPRYQR